MVADPGARTMHSPFHKNEPLPARFWRALRRRFSASRYFRRRDGLLRLSEGGPSQEWVLARELCVFNLVDAAAVPPRKRRGFIGISMARWAPFPDADCHVEWAADRAMVWAWPRSMLRDAADGVVRVAPWRVVPESLLRGEPLAGGEVLVAMDRGVEARVWRDHALVASQWWEQAPELGEWNEFRRGAGLAPAAATPLVEGGGLADVPWRRRRSRALGDVAQEYRTHLAALAVGLAAAAVCIPVASAIKLRVATHQIEREIAGQDARLKRILDARDAAARDVDAIQRLLGLRPPAGQIRLLAAVTELVPAGAGEMLEWRMPDASNLEVAFRMANPDPAGLARAWEASELFEGVSVELGPNPEEVRIKARIVRPAATGAAK